MASVARNRLGAHLNGTPAPKGRRADLAIVAPAPQPPASPWELPFAKEMAAEAVRVALRAYEAARDHQYDLIRRADVDSAWNDEAQRQMDLLGDDQFTKPHPLNEWIRHADAAHRQALGQLARAVVMATGQAVRYTEAARGDFAWVACGVRLDGQMVSVQPFVYDGDQGGGTPSYDFEQAVMTIVNVAEVADLDGRQDLCAGSAA